MKPLRVLLLGVLLIGALVAAVRAAPPDRERLNSTRRKAEDARRELRATRAATAAAGAQLDRVQLAEEAAGATLQRVQASLAAEKQRVQRLAVEVRRARRRYDSRRTAVARRLRAMYIAGSPPPALVLLSSPSLGELSVRRDLLRRIAARDRADLEALDRARRYLARREAESRASVGRILDLNAKGERYARGLAGARRAKESVIARLQDRRETLAAAIAQFDADERRIESEIALYVRRAAARDAARAAARLAAARATRVAAGRTGRPTRPDRIAIEPEPPEPKFAGRFGSPADGPRTSGYGMRFHPILKINRMHQGLDYGGGYGAAVRAAAGGTVITAATRGSYGLVVILDHGDGVSTIYAHLSATAVAEGQRVTRGQRIGSIGSSGLSTGPHLHFEALRAGRRVNPAGLF